MNRLLFILLLATNTCTAQMFQDVQDTILTEYFSTKIGDCRSRQIKVQDGKQSIVMFQSTLATNRYVWFDMETGTAKLLNEKWQIIEEGKVTPYDCPECWRVHYQVILLGPKSGFRCNWKGVGYGANKTGEWKRYYDNGRVRWIYNYDSLGGGRYKTDISGDFKEFYPNGKLAIEGAYKLVANNVLDTYWVTEPETMQEKMIVWDKGCKHSAKTGIWRYYNKDGTLKYKEDYP